LNKGEQLTYIKRFIILVKPPVTEWRFWQIQVLILIVLAARSTVDAFFKGSEVGYDYVVLALLLVPIVYAALHYGLRGSFLSALWACLLMLPDILTDKPLNKLIDATILSMILTVAVTVGWRVGEEKKAREAAEHALRRHREAERKYELLFESSLTPVVLINQDLRVQEYNRAASQLFGERITGGLPISELIQVSLPADDSETSERVYLNTPGGKRIALRVRIARINEFSGNRLYQLVLQDVTEEARREMQAANYAQAVLRAQEQERLRIAEELHDDPVQELVYLTQKIDLVSYRVADTWLKERLGELRSIVLDVIQKLRKLAHDLRPSLLDNLGLPAAIERIAHDVAETSGLNIRLSIGNNRYPLDKWTELVLFRITQEALNNIVRHAHAKHVEVSLRFEDMGLRLLVMDDGIGFDESKVFSSVEENKSLGLLGMHERARLIGADLRISSTPGNGTTVEVYVKRPHATNTAKVTGSSASFN